MFEFLDSPLFYIILIGGVIYNLWSATEKERREEEVHKTVVDQKEVLEKQVDVLKNIEEKPYTKIYHGTVFENIANSTIINGSTVIDSINSIGNNTDVGLAEALIEVADLIENEKNQLYYLLIDYLMLF